MSTTPHALVEHEPVDSVTPVRIDAASLDSTSPEHLRDLHAELAETGIAPVELVVDACFDEDCSIATETEANRIRGHVRAAVFLGANRLTVRIDDDELSDSARTALTACAERAQREGLSLDVEGSAGEAALKD
ncbi:hypothetical protein [Salinarchaeum laminariae]|uniref:hypothetical protein n=1 Tax=Salinarchaeum laminariae TaxID=869888 RepID=UPI0020C0F043|nr:hypothetical protein [Salinarchaeum laminariae]